jgi:excisionase family DNA binding protein
MDDYMTAKEVAAKVKLSEQTIRRYTMLKQIPFHKIVRAVRYKPSEIEKWIEDREAGGTHD